MKDMEKEKEKLKKTIEDVNDALLEEKENLNAIYDTFIGTHDDLVKILQRKEVRIKNLNKSLDNPYFARLDFKTIDDEKKHVIYIGKNGVSKGSKIIITDWRAPISSLYYDSELGKCSFDAPEGTINGILDLKRQYEIDNGKLIDYFDVDLVSNDALLQKYLNENNDNRLKSIVATIQKEQNDVIRKALSKNLIIQGVAGSGKTTVALHRIAYLVYNYINSVNQSQYLVIGPNPVFLKYIKSVLPELDVSGVSQCTFETFSKEYINEKLALTSSDEKVDNIISHKLSTDVEKFKSSMKYKKLIDLFYQAYLQSLTEKDLKLNDFVVLKSANIRETFKQINMSNNSSLSTKIEITIDKLTRLIESNEDIILSRYSDYSFKLFEEANSIEEKEKLKLMFAKDRNEIKKACRSILKKYFSKSKIDATKLYKIFISSIDCMKVDDYNLIIELKTNTLSNIKKKKYDFEDLSALLYLKSMINPERKYGLIKHVVIDEAQDFGEFNFYVLKNIFKNATFSIFGDLAQSIYDYRGIEKWSKVNEIMFENSAELVNFTKSYRTTAEIMSSADDVAEFIGLNRSDLVVRHGNQVNIQKIINEEMMIDFIIGKIKDYKEQGYKTIAIISKTEELSNNLNQQLEEKGIIVPNVTLNDDLSDEKFNICTISNQLAKGLEFDSVIIANGSENIYSSKNTLDMKLLYVAITRALHNLDIVYQEELSKPLNNTLMRKSNKYK